MDILYPNLFNALFETDVPRIILRIGKPEFEILKYNTAFKNAKPLEEMAIIGKELWEVYDKLDDNKLRKQLLKEGINKAIEESRIVKLEPFRLINEIYPKEISWHQLEIVPIYDQKNKLISILISGYNITDEILRNRELENTEKREKELNDELVKTNKKLFITNEYLSQSNLELSVAVDNLHRAQIELKQLNNSLEEKVKDRVQAIEHLYKEQLELSDEIATINEELKTIVEELSESNEQLYLSKKEIELKNEALSESEERFRNLIRQAPVGICVISTSAYLIEVINEDFIALVGKPRAHLENKSLWEAMPETKEIYTPIIDNVISTGIGYKSKEREVLLYRNGIYEYVFVDFVVEPIRNLQGKVEYLMILVIDITDKVKARQRIEDVEERIRLAIEVTEMGTYDYNPKSKRIITTPQLNKIFDLPEVSSSNQLMEAFHPEDVIKCKRALINAKSGGKLFYEARVIHQDNSVHWVRVHGNLYFNELGEAKRLLGTVKDITEYKYLLQQKDDFISIASHELKTPITSLKASFQLLHRMKDDFPNSLAQRLIEQSNKSMQRISELVEELLDVGRISEGSLKLKKKTFDINVLLDECYHNLKNSENPQLILEKSEPYEVFADEHRIEQVVVNLVNNAFKYAPNSDKIILKTELTNDYLKVIVKDNGPGVSPEKLPYLFERYYRADSSGSKVSGLGLGLYICKEIIEKHSGEIGVDSTIGNGSAFWFTLPKG